jgi:DNA-binding CsgD family transcriptional regulator
MLRPHYVIELSREERQRMEALRRAGKTPQRLAKRATIILLAAEGLNNQQIADQLEIARNLVQKWRKRCALSAPSRPGDPLARLRALADLDRSGRPPVFSPAGPARGGCHSLSPSRRIRL